MSADQRRLLADLASSFGAHDVAVAVEPLVRSVVLDCPFVEPSAAATRGEWADVLRKWRVQGQGQRAARGAAVAAELGDAADRWRIVAMLMPLLDTGDGARAPSEADTGPDSLIELERLLLGDVADGGAGEAVDGDADDEDALLAAWWRERAEDDEAETVAGAAAEAVGGSDASQVSAVQANGDISALPLHHVGDGDGAFEPGIVRFPHSRVAVLPLLADVAAASASTSPIAALVAALEGVPSPWLPMEPADHCTGELPPCREPWHSLRSVPLITWHAQRMAASLRLRPSLLDALIASAAGSPSSAAPAAPRCCFSVGVDLVTALAASTNPGSAASALASVDLTRAHVRAIVGAANALLDVDSMASQVVAASNSHSEGGTTTRTANTHLPLFGPVAVSSAVALRAAVRNVRAALRRRLAANATQPVTLTQLRRAVSAVGRVLPSMQLLLETTLLAPLLPPDLDAEAAMAAVRDQHLARLAHPLQPWLDRSAAVRLGDVLDAALHQATDEATQTRGDTVAATPTLPSLRQLQAEHAAWWMWTAAPAILASRCATAALRLLSGGLHAQPPLLVAACVHALAAYVQTAYRVAAIATPLPAAAGDAAHSYVSASALREPPVCSGAVAAALASLTISHAAVELNDESGAAPPADAAWASPTTRRFLDAVDAAAAARHIERRGRPATAPAIAPLSPAVLLDDGGDDGDAWRDDESKMGTPGGEPCDPSGAARAAAALARAVTAQIASALPSPTAAGAPPLAGDGIWVVVGLEPLHLRQAFTGSADGLGSMWATMSLFRRTATLMTQQLDASPADEPVEAVDPARATLQHLDAAEQAHVPHLPRLLWEALLIHRHGPLPHDEGLMITASITPLAATAGAAATAGSGGSNAPGDEAGVQAEASGADTSIAPIGTAAAVPATPLHQIRQRDVLPAATAPTATAAPPSTGIGSGTRIIPSDAEVIAVGGSSALTGAPLTTISTTRPPSTLSTASSAARAKPVLGRGIVPMPGLKRSAWWDIDAQVDVRKGESERRREAAAAGATPTSNATATPSSGGDVSLPSSDAAAPVARASDGSDHGGGGGGTALFLRGRRGRTVGARRGSRRHRKLVALQPSQRHVLSAIREGDEDDGSDATGASGGSADDDGASTSDEDGGGGPRTPPASASYDRTSGDARPPTGAPSVSTFPFHELLADGGERTARGGALTLRHPSPAVPHSDAPTSRAHESSWPAVVAAVHDMLAAAPAAIALSAHVQLAASPAGPLARPLPLAQAILMTVVAPLRDLLSRAQTGATVQLLAPPPHTEHGGGAASSLAWMLQAMRIVYFLEGGALLSPWLTALFEAADAVALPAAAASAHVSPARRAIGWSPFLLTRSLQSSLAAALSSMGLHDDAAAHTLSRAFSVAPLATDRLSAAHLDGGALLGAHAVVVVTPPTAALAAVAGAPAVMAAHGAVLRRLLSLRYCAHRGAAAWAAVRMLGAGGWMGELLAHPSLRQAARRLAVLRGTVAAFLASLEAHIAVAAVVMPWQTLLLQLEGAQTPADIAAALHRYALSAADGAWVDADATTEMAGATTALGGGAPLLMQRRRTALAAASRAVASMVASASTFFAACVTAVAAVQHGAAALEAAADEAAVADRYLLLAAATGAADVAALKRERKPRPRLAHAMQHDELGPVVDAAVAAATAALADATRLGEALQRAVGSWIHRVGSGGTTVGAGGTASSTAMVAMRLDFTGWYTRR